MIGRIKIMREIKQVLVSNKLRGCIPLVLITTILFSVFLVISGNLFELYVDNGIAVDAVTLESGVPVIQDISMDVDNISSLSLLFGTFARTNEGCLNVTLYDDDEVVKEWTYETGMLQDGISIEFELSHPYRLIRGHHYYFSVEEDFSGDNAIAIYRTTDNNEANDVCYGIRYKELSLYSHTILIAALLVITVILLYFLTIDERAIMTVIAIALGIVYFWLCPLGMAPDERNHYLRAYEISHGYLVSEHIGDSGVGGNYLPSNMDAYMDAYSDENATLDWSETEEFTFGNTSLYSAVTYLPQSIGILVAERLFTNRAEHIFYAGRMGGFIVSMTLSILALWIIPFGRKIVFMILLFPMTLQEMISMSPDGFMIALSIFLLSYILYLSYSSNKLKIYDYIFLGLTCIVLSLCKIVYIVLLFLILLIPSIKFCSNKIGYIYKIGVIVVSVILNLFWLWISSGYLVEFNPGVNSAEQVKFVLTNIPAYYSIVVKTTLMNGSFYISSMFGSHMGALSIGISPIVWISFLILFVYVIANNSDYDIRTNKADKYIMMFVFLLGCAL